MSRFDSGSPGGPADSTLELVMAAAAAQNASRPRYLIVAALAFLLGSIAYLVWVIAAQGAAAQQLGRASTNLANVKSTVAQVKEAYNPEARRRFDPDPTIINKLTTIAEACGLPGIVPSTAADIRNVKGYVVKQYSVNVTEKDPAVLLTWLSRVTGDTEIPGLDLARVKFTPGFVLPSGVVGWNMEATFRRWQRDN